MECKDRKLLQAALDFQNSQADPDINDIKDFFIAGAEWMAEQDATDMIFGTVCGRVRDHINVRFDDGIGELLAPKNVSHIPADVSKYNIGDKVKIQIRKE